MQRTGDGIRPFSLINGPGGDLWFAFTGAAGGYDGIGRIDPSTGKVQLASTDPYVPDGIAFGADGALSSSTPPTTSLGASRSASSDSIPPGRKAARP